jgi:hypothetical protein
MAYFDGASRRIELRRLEDLSVQEDLRYVSRAVVGVASLTVGVDDSEEPAGTVEDSFQHGDAVYHPAGDRSVERRLNVLPAPVGAVHRSGVAVPIKGDREIRCAISEHRHVPVRLLGECRIPNPVGSGPGGDAPVEAQLPLEHEPSVVVEPDETSPAVVPPPRPGAVGSFCCDETTRGIILPILAASAVVPNLYQRAVGVESPRPGESSRVVDRFDPSVPQGVHRFLPVRIGVDVTISGAVPVAVPRPVGLLDGDCLPRVGAGPRNRRPHPVVPPDTPEHPVGPIEFDTTPGAIDSPNASAVKADRRRIQMGQSNLHHLLAGGTDVGDRDEVLSRLRLDAGYPSRTVPEEGEVPAR